MPDACELVLFTGRAPTTETTETTKKRAHSSRSAAPASVAPAPPPPAPPAGPTPEEVDALLDAILAARASGSTPDLERARAGLVARIGAYNAMWLEAAVLKGSHGA